MYRAVLTAAAAAVLVIGGVTPAVAAPSSRLPGAPTSVQVSGAGDGATVTWSPPRSGGTVTGWRVRATPAIGQSHRSLDRLPATVRSDRFDSIHAGVTYWFAVRATTSRGSGPEVRVRYTAPRHTAVAQSLFALDASGALVRYPTSGRGTPRTVAAQGAGYTADRNGNVFVPSADGCSITLYPADGGAPRVIASGLHLTPDLRSDVAGNLYWVDSVSNAITKLPLTGVATVVLPSSGTYWTVGRDGTVSAWTATISGGTVVSASPRGAVQTRTVVPSGGNSIGYPVALLADGHGTLYLGTRSPGGSYYHSWWSLPAGSSTASNAPGPIRYQFSATNQDSLVLGQSAEWCAALSEASPIHPCVADHTVTHLLAVNATGVVKDTATSGALQVESNGLYVGAADTAGDLFVDAGSRTPGLWRVPAAGGPTQQLSPGEFTRLLVI